MALNVLALHVFRLFSKNRFLKPLDRLMRRTKTFALWGGNISQLAFDKMKEAGLFLLSFYGKKINTWSIPIDVRDSKSEIKSSLLRFNDSLKITNYKETFALGMQSLHDNAEVNFYINELFPTFFPKIRYIHFVIKGDQPKYCIDSSKDRK